MNAKEWLLSRVFEIDDDVYPEGMGVVELSNALEYGERVKAERETGVTYFDGVPVRIGDKFQRLRFVGWDGKAFEVSAIIDGQIVYMTGNLGAANADPQDCIKYDEDLHESIKRLFKKNKLSPYGVEEFLKENY